MLQLPDCCPAMRAQVETWDCDCSVPRTCPDALIVPDPGRERLVLRAENACYDLAHCPWCGTLLQGLGDPGHDSQRVLGP